MVIRPLELDASRYINGLNIMYVPHISVSSSINGKYDHVVNLSTEYLLHHIIPLSGYYLIYVITLLMASWIYQKSEA